jgi:DNA-cytosine methyltransferase
MELVNQYIAPEGQLSLPLSGMNFIDICSGIGGFRFGMEAAGHKCVGWVEIDKHPRKSYMAIHDTEGEWTREDVTQISEADLEELLETADNHVDIICGGFPCQSFSQAGSRRGFEDTRGTIFFNIAEIANYLKPKWLFLENVTGLLTHDKGNTLRTILMTLNEMGYYPDIQILNSKDFGVPQSRDRIFIVAIRKDLIDTYQQPTEKVEHARISRFKQTCQGDLLEQGVEFFNFNFPKGDSACTPKLRDILEDEVDEKYYISDEKVRTIMSNL